MPHMILTSERDRELLSQKIFEVLESWPELNRQIFVRAHYWGDTTEMISGSLGLEAGEVRRILGQCERRLRTSLRTLRLQLTDPERAGSESTVVYWAG